MQGAGESGNMVEGARSVPPTEKILSLAMGQGAGRGPGGRRGAGIWRQARLTEKILFLNSGSMMFMRAVRELEKSCADASG